VALPVRPPFEPMLAKLTRDMPSLPDLLFEPKWDGFRCVVFRDGDDLDLQSRNQKPLLRYFPEMREPLLEQLPPQVVLDGELVIVTPKGLDFDALQLRQHPAASRVKKLAEEIPASFVAFDLLALGKESMLHVPMRDRRAALEKLLAGALPPLFVTPASTSRDLAVQWFDHFEGAGFDGVIAKPLADPYAPGKRTLLKVKHERTCECVAAGFRIHKDGNGVGSILLGLYDDDGVLHHVGVGSGMAAAVRERLLGEIEPLRKNALKHHPWKEWADAMSEAAESGQRMPGGPNRWNASKDMSWEPLRIERVVEVSYEGLMNGRFRHNAHFRAWRDDKNPQECTYSQLDELAPTELLEMFGV
jgi:ATP-dependent DNA ligase